MEPMVELPLELVQLMDVRLSTGMTVKTLDARLANLDITNIRLQAITILALHVKMVVNLVPDLISAKDVLLVIILIMLETVELVLMDVLSVPMLLLALLVLLVSTSNLMDLV
jgi:hypothetical protein